MRLKGKRTMFIHTNEPSTSFYIKSYLVFAELAMNQRWSAIFCASGAWGSKMIGIKMFETCRARPSLPQTSGRNGPAQSAWISWADQPDPVYFVLNFLNIKRRFDVTK